MSHAPNRRNHYRLLHVQPEAPLEVIKASYRTLMMRMKLHPDLGGDHDLAAAINEAYAVLSDPHRRVEYDRQLRLRSGPEMMRRPTWAQPDPPRAAAPAPPAPPNQPAPQSAACAAPPTAAMAPQGDLYARSAHRAAATARITCAFCRIENACSKMGAPLCARCGAPLTPVRLAPIPNFSGTAMNRRLSTRRPRQAEAVAYWGMPPQRHLVKWRDLSAGGLSVWSAQALAVGARMQLMDPEIHTVAEVVACEPGPDQQWLVRARLVTLRPIKRSGLFYATQA